MRKALSVAVALVIFAGIANAQLTTLQLFPNYTNQFDFDPLDPALAPDGSELVDGTGAVQVVSANLWARIDTDKLFNSIGFSIHTTGDLEVVVEIPDKVQDWAFNGTEFVPATGGFPPGPLLTQVAETASDRTADTGAGDAEVVAFAVTTAGFGSTTGTAEYDPISFAQNPTSDVWIGTITVTGTAGEVYFDMIASALRGGVKGDVANVYGWAASPIIDTQENVGTVADAPFMVITPEPASLVLLALAGLMIRRR